MIIARTLSDLQKNIGNWRQSPVQIALVPTMGNLHHGHLALLAEARKLANYVVASIFVNPTQFGVGEDFACYPRTEQEDLEKLRQLNVDLVFLPSVDEMYCPDAKTVVTVLGLSDSYCGASRPGHFSGVATVVCKLLNMIQPNIAVFGLKDYQQLAVIRTLVRDLNIPVTIIGVETVREANGLAMSSRNNYLTEQEKAIAPLLFQSLCHARKLILEGRLTYPEITQQTKLFLAGSGFQPDYFAVCRSSDLAEASLTDNELILLVAAKLGKTRLIDNLCFSKQAV